MFDTLLSAQQLQVIDALSNGATVTAAAQQAGIHRNTITNWRRNHLVFQRALADAQYDRALLYREKIEDLVDLAVASLHQILTDPKTSPSVRLKAALTVLQISAKPPEPKQQIELVLETVPVPSAPPVHKPAQPGPVSPSPVVHNPAQRTIRRDHPKIGRNELCPCQSGLKYKRCCFDKPHSPALAQAA